MFIYCSRYNKQSNKQNANTTRPHTFFHVNLHGIRQNRQTHCGVQFVEVKRRMTSAVSPVYFHRLPLGARTDHKDPYVKVSITQYGRGLFATSTLPKLFAVGPYAGPCLTEAEADIEQRFGNVYLFDLADNMIIDARVKSTSNALRYANAADTRQRQNCTFHTIAGEVWLVTDGVVNVDEELLGSYGKSAKDLIYPNIRAVNPVDPVWMRHMIQNGAYQIALTESEKHRRYLEEKISDLEEKLAEALATSLKHECMNKTRTITVTGKSNQRMMLLTAAATEVVRADSQQMEEDRKKLKRHKSTTSSGHSANPEFGIRQTSKGWTGYHCYKAVNFRSNRDTISPAQWADLKKRAEAFSETGVKLEAAFNGDDVETTTADGSCSDEFDALTMLGRQKDVAGVKPSCNNEEKSLQVRQNPYAFSLLGKLQEPLLQRRQNP